VAITLKSIDYNVAMTVHATRRLVQNLTPDHVIVKLDFSNAFSCLRRDAILDTVAAKMLEIYRLVHAAYSCEPILVYSKHEKEHSKDIRWGHLNFALLYTLYSPISSQQSRLVLWMTLPLLEMFKQLRQTSTPLVTAV